MRLRLASSQARSARACHFPDSTERVTIGPPLGCPWRIHSWRRIVLSGPTIGIRRPSPAYALLDAVTMISSASQKTCGHCALPISLRRMPV